MYVGVDSVLGWCKCKTDELDEVCDEECRAENSDRLELHCPEPPLEPFIRITDRADSSGVKRVKVSFILIDISGIGSFVKNRI